MPLYFKNDQKLKSRGGFTRILENPTTLVSLRRCHSNRSAKKETLMARLVSRMYLCTLVFGMELANTLLSYFFSDCVCSCPTDHVHSAQRKI